MVEKSIYNSKKGKKLFMAYSVEELSQVSSILSNISSAIIALVSIYVSLSYNRWRQEEVIRRRAGIAQSCIEHMERFFSRIERLIESEYNMQDSEWGKSFYEAFDSQFRSAAIEADTLASKDVQSRFHSIEVALKSLPLTKVSGGENPDKTHDEAWEKAVAESKSKIATIWEKSKKEWEELKELLGKEALIKS